MSEHPAPTRPPVSTTDLVVMLVVGLAAIPAVLLLGFFVLGFATMGTAACGPGECEAFGVLLTVGFVASPLAALVGAVVSLVQLVRRRRAWPWIVGGTVIAGVTPFVVLLLSFFLA